jgi:radical SAM protein with 4Fe4S-binding SPASM domain
MKTENGVYSTDKVLYHPKVVEAFITHNSHYLPPIFIQLMPQNVCNQNCHFCSYRLDNWKNSEKFNDKTWLEWEVLNRALDDMKELNVKAIEITGGGEPLAYQYIHELLEYCTEWGVETSLVTNGSLLNDKKADALFKTNLKWARVSIDSGKRETYEKIREAKHWGKAWEGIARLVERRTDQAIGVGFVVTNENFDEVYMLCEKAAEYKVDNVRVSVAFTPKGASIITPEQVSLVCEQIEYASMDFKIDIPNVFKERVDNLNTTQDYDYCGSKDLLCVIEGEGKVYTCCTLTGSDKGIMGNIKDSPFKDIWRDMSGWRKNLNPSKLCNMPCLYESRNKIMNKLRNPPKHLNFI